MAFKFVPCFWRCTAKSMQNSHIFHRSIIIPPNVGEPTRTNQEVIQALTRAIIGGMRRLILGVFRFKKFKSVTNIIN